METLRLFLKEADLQPTVSFSADLYHCEPAQFVSQLRKVDSSVGTVLIVGHNPGMESFLAQLTGETYPFPTAALAMLELEIAEWSQLQQDTRGRLIDIWQPRSLED